MLDSNGKSIEIGARVTQVGGVVEALVMNLDYDKMLVLIESDDEIDAGYLCWLQPDRIEVID